MGTIVIYGGTFNPVHKGHVKSIEAVSKALNPDRIIIMPSKIPPHKEAPDLASEQDRLEMCRLAFSGINNVQISDFELKRNEKSYSIYTVKHIKEKYPDDKVIFALGSDMLMTFDQWFCYKEILSMCDLVCISRENGDFTALKNKANLLSEYGEITILNVEPFEISSTEIREMLKNKSDTSCYLDEIVVKYIEDNNIYK